MIIHGVEKLQEFWLVYRDAEGPIKSWYMEAQKATWKTPAEVKQHYGSASILADHRAVFNIKGKHYRLAVKINYSYGIIYILFIGTHEKYDQIDVTKI
jgi:mRNA interferase HigB